MEATEKEKQLVNRILKLKISLAIAVTVAVLFIFAAVEYRPIVVSSRTVSASTAYQPSTTRYTDVSVSVQVSCNLSLTGGQAGNWVIQTSPTSGGTYSTVNQITGSNTGTLTIGLNTTQVSGGVLKAIVPPGYWYKIVSTSTTGTATFSILGNSQETQL